MLSTVASAGLMGSDGFIVHCEADVGDGLPGISMIGLLSSEVREAADRVRTAIRNSGIYIEPRKITVNLAPADIRKEGSGYDLAVAVALLRSYGFLKASPADRFISESVFIGELSLSGRVLPVRGVLSMACAARDAGFRKVFVPSADACEGAVIDGIDCYGVNDLKEIISVLTGDRALPEPEKYEDDPAYYGESRDFSDISGQEMVKRATAIAVAGRHNILYIGPAGTGKSMIAGRIPSIMPRMSKEERIEISKLYSISGLLPEGKALISERPFRSPHHTISPQALAGGGSSPKPGEISLATGGVLFLDELAEFKSPAIEILRQPMEERRILISRVSRSIEYPADFILCAATNPCRCGFYPDRSRCRCTQAQVNAYLGRISKPIMDRIDICVETAIPRYQDLTSPGGDSGESGSNLRERVEAVRKIQKDRFIGLDIEYNAQMNPKQIRMFCGLDDEDEAFLAQVYQARGMSARSLHKTLRVARTVADYEGNRDITHENLCEALMYRLLEEKYWGGGSSSADSGRIDIGSYDRRQKTDIYRGRNGSTDLVL